MQLLFDIGNTRIKAALHRDGKLVPLEATSTKLDAVPADWSGHGVPQAIYVSTVAAAETTGRLANWAQQMWSLPITKITLQQGAGGVRTRYAQPHQLGIDRWLAAVAGYNFADGAVCVIDAGTALTVDVVDGEGIHHGGMIAPGLALMIESLMTETANLRVHELDVPAEFALNTQSAISLGCTEYIAGLLDRVSSRLERLDIVDCAWIVTGGEAETVRDLAARPVVIVDDLVLRGIAIVAECG